MIGSDRWEMLERIGAYVAGELSGEEARQMEQFILENTEGRRLAESYARMLVLLNAIGQESPEPSEAIMNYAIRRATVSAFFRQVEEFFASIGRAYFDAFIYYMGLRVSIVGGPDGQRI